MSGGIMRKSKVEMAKPKAKILDPTFPSPPPITVNGVSDGGTVADSLPWTVTGTVTVSTSSTLTAMAYQINDGAINSFTTPGDTGGTFTFQLTSDDIPGNGSFSLTIYAWDSNNASNSQTLTIQAVGITPTILPTLGCCS